MFPFAGRAAHWPTTFNSHKYKLHVYTYARPQRGRKKNETQRHYGGRERERGEKKEGDLQFTKYPFESARASCLFKVNERKKKEAAAR